MTRSSDTDQRRQGVSSSIRREVAGRLQPNGRSSDQQAIRRQSQIVRSIGLGSLPFLLLLGVWVTLYSHKLVPTWLLASPLTIVGNLGKLVVSGSVWELIWNSFLNSFLAFSLALAAAVVIGLWLGRSSLARQIWFPFLAFLYPIPSLAWLPLIIILFGFSRTSILVLVGLSAFFKIVFNVVTGVRSVDQTLIWAAQSFGFRGLKLITSVILPSAFPHILTGIRLGFGSAWRSLVGAEIIIPVAGGLGAFIAHAQDFFRFDQVIAGILVIAAVSFTIEKLVFEAIERRTLIRYGLFRD